MSKIDINNLEKYAEKRDNVEKIKHRPKSSTGSKKKRKENKHKSDIDWSKFSNDED